MQKPFIFTIIVDFYYEMISTLWYKANPRMEDTNLSTTWTAIKVPPFLDLICFLAETYFKIWHFHN